MKVYSFEGTVAKDFVSTNEGAGVGGYSKLSNASRRIKYAVNLIFYSGNFFSKLRIATL